MPFPVEERFITRTEEKLGVKFPLSFSSRMKRSNGGEIEAADDHWQIHPFYDDSDRRRLRSTCNDIVRETASSRKWASFPKGAVAIGDNGTGDKLIFIPDPKNAALLGTAVFLWFHETGEFEKVVSDYEELV